MADSLSRFRKRSGSRSKEDEWFIPYNKPSKNLSSPGIGNSPAPVRQPSHNLLGYFTGPSSPTAGRGERKSFKFPPLPPTPYINDTPTLGGLRKAPSYGSLRNVGASARLPSSNSVPTGLSAPRMLFSPLSRDLRASSSTVSLDRADSPRARTFSAPTKRHRSNLSQHWDDTPPRQWAAPTVCDRLVIARPNIIPHVITPPCSPEDQSSDMFSEDGPRAVDEARQRAEERDQWAKYAKSRRRSRSFGNEPPSVNAPIVGNAKVRAEEIQRRNSQTRSRSNSISSRLKRRLSRSKSSTDLRPSFLHVDSDQSVGASTSFGFVKRTSGSKTPSDQNDFTPSSENDPFQRLAPGSTYQKGHAHTQSSPELFSRPRRPAPGPPHRTLRIQSPPIRRQGVVIIGAEPDPSTWVPRKAPVPLDFSKPLPDLPVDAETDTGFDHTTPIETKANEAAEPSSTDVSSMAPLTAPSPANARSYLAQQHLKDRTRKAFQTPASRISVHRLRTSDPIDLNFAKGDSKGSPARRPTAMEEAINRSRAASTSTLENRDAMSRLHSERLHTNSYEGTPEIPRIVSTSPSFSPQPALAYPISTESHNLYVVPPQVMRTDTGLSKASAKSVYTDASEGWGRSGVSTPVSRDISVDEATPSAEDDLSDRFKGLFFRTPKELSSPFTIPSSRTAPSTVSFPSLSPDSGTPTGLGFGLEQNAVRQEPKRQSYVSAGTSDGTDTVEITTPSYIPDVSSQQAAYLRFVEESDETSPRRLVEAYLTSSTNTMERSSSIRTASHAVSHRTSEEFRLLAAPVRRATIISTPPQAANAERGESRTEIIQGTPDDSPASEIDFSVLSPGTFGAENRDIEVPNPLETPRVEVPDTPVSPAIACSPQGRTSFDTKRYSAVPSFVQDFPHPPAPVDVRQSL